MIGVVVVLVVMHHILMNMNVRMPARTASLLQAPGKIHQAKRQQRPSGQAATQALDFDKGNQLSASHYANGTDDDRAENVSQTAIECYP